MAMLWLLKRRYARSRRFVVAASAVLDGSKPQDQKKMARLMADLDLAKRNLERELSVSILTEADDLDIELPPDNEPEIWMTGDVNGEAINLLTTRGREKVRQLVDAERSRRFEVKTLWVTKFWLPLLAALVGIIGALTGLVAVLQHKK
jgi:hypothetical protein